MKHPTVLLAEDEALVRQGVKAMLEKESVTSKIYEAANGAEALDILQQYSIDVVLLDIKMPGKGGMETLKEIKKSFPGTHVIIVTGIEGTELILNVLKEGVHGFVQKLNGFEEVLKAITVVTEGGRYFPETVLQVIYNHSNHWTLPLPFN